MRTTDSARLLLLAAIWGASFLFMRIAAPPLGPVVTAELRTLIAGLALAAWLGIPEWRRWGPHYIVVGIVGSAIPFLLWAYAALNLSAGLLSVLNATAPMWGALCTAIFLRERLSALRVLGLVIGIVGVALVSRPAGDGALHYPAIAAALVAALFYGLVATYIKRWASEAPARGMAVGSQLAAGTILVPLIVFWPPAGVPSVGVVASILALGLVCGAVAFILYFRLIADLGAPGALTVTFLIPVFGVLWGFLFLDEPLSITMLAGAALVVLGTVFVLRN